MDAIKNFVRSNIDPIDASATSITGADVGSRFPDPTTEGEYNVVLWNVDDYPDPADDPNREIVRAISKSGNTLTIIRGQENTTAKTHNASGKQHKAILTLTSKTAKEWHSLPIKVENENEYTFPDGRKKILKTITDGEHYQILNEDGSVETEILI